MSALGSEQQQDLQCHFHRQCLPAMEAFLHTHKHVCMSTSVSHKARVGQLQEMLCSAVIVSKREV